MFSDLINKIQRGERAAVARAITAIENTLPGHEEILAAIYPFRGRAFRIGITGPPGAGKSSLTDKLVTLYRQQHKNVAVIGVDPTSPFTGGALLGDRIRMLSHFDDPGVFIRSMGSRGGHGGLATRTQEVGDVFEAAGFDIILFETVGVGQVELDVVQATDSVVVVLVPESGDEIQMMKAGLMEIGDLFVINKADRADANKLKVTLTNILNSAPQSTGQWRPEVLMTVATTGEGLDPLFKMIGTHLEYIRETGLWQQKMDARYARQVREQVSKRFDNTFWTPQKKQALEDQLSLKPADRINPIDMAGSLFVDG
ncbi:MAG: methylmalonyl Co-A mutase-associated GTPase MeaB [FCB group bacterium]|nr:methylmalonyl Co-A mutase-associated GTPase MeaB [FCB group bacterium]